MEEVIHFHHILINQHADSWEDAIRQAAAPLIKSEAIKEAYVDSMINSVKTLGPYIVIMPHFALAHAAPSDAVKRSEISIATFVEDVIFHSDNDPVKVVMCLACKDKTSHMKQLSLIAEKLMKEEIIEQICACQSVPALYELLNQ